MKRDNIYKTMNYFAAMLVVAMVGVGCQKESIEEIPCGEESAINFSVDVAATKGSLTIYDESSSDGTNNFTKFLAYGSEVSEDTPTTIVEEIFSGTEVSLSEEDNEWHYTQTKYLSPSSVMTVMAVAPYDLSDHGLGATAAANSLSISYTVPETVATQPDLMVATVAPTSDVDDVNLTFDHQLSAISFSVKGDDLTSIESLKISGVYSSGKLVATADDTKTREWALEPITDINKEFEPGLTENTTPNSDGSELNITADNGYLMMIPQTLGGAAQIEITIKNNTTSEVVATRYTALGTSVWEAGKRYDYCYTLDAKIGVLEDPAVTVTEWGEPISQESTYGNDMVDVEAKYAINLNVYNTDELLKAAIEERLALGITDLVVYGAAYDGLLGGGTSSNPSVLSSTEYTPTVSDGEVAEGDMTTIGATSYDLSRVTGLTDTDTNYAFYQNQYLNTVTFPKSITKIGTDAFFDSNITAIDLPNVTTIGEDAFLNCSNLTSVNLPILTTVEEGGFGGCRALTTISLPSLTDAGKESFMTCSNLKNIDMPVLYFAGVSAFCGCVNLTSVSMPILYNVGDNAFQSCRALETITLPNASQILEEAFMDCSNLKTIYLPNAGDIYQKVFYNIADDANIYLTRSAGVIIKCYNDSTLESDNCEQWENYNLHISNGLNIDGTYEFNCLFVSNPNSASGYDAYQFFYSNTMDPSNEEYTWRSMSYVDENYNIVSTVPYTKQR